MQNGLRNIDQDMPTGTVVIRMLWEESTTSWLDLRSDPQDRAHAWTKNLVVGVEPVTWALGESLLLLFC